MNGRRLLLDSNIIIYIAKKDLAPEEFIQPHDLLFISDISFMETLGYSFGDSVEKKETGELISIVYRLSIDEMVTQKVIDIRQERRMKLPDAIIAATDLVHGCTIVTRNISDFAGLTGVDLVNPFEARLSKG